MDAQLGSRFFDQGHRQAFASPQRYVAAACKPLFAPGHPTPKPGSLEVRPPGAQRL
ncbi:MAG: hypothetical protein ACK58M_27690 [Acidobacteriota bacterium]